MSELGAQAEFREAALEMHRYLSGDIAPMMVADTFELLAGNPPELTARIVGSWIHSQYARGGGSVADLVFHALTKVHQLSEFGLVTQDRMIRFLQALSVMLLPLCPEEERADLKVRLSRIGEVETTTTSRVEILHRPAGAPAAPTAAAPAKAAASTDVALERGMRKLTLLLERLGAVVPAGEPSVPGTIPTAGPAGGPALDPAILAQVLTTAALEARTGAELETYLGRVRQQGLAAPIGEVFRALGRSLPGWMLAPTSEESAAAIPKAKPIEAMHKLVALAPDAVEAGRRVGEMTYAAIEQFNEGRLAQAVAILDEVSRLIADHKTDPSMVGTVLGQAQATLSETTLKRFSESADKHPLLRRVLAFFPGWRPDGILDALDGEEKRDRRKLLLSLYAVHGDDGRAPLLSRLDAYGRGEVRDANGWYKRNLIFLLRRLPDAGPDALHETLPHLEAALGLGEPPMVVKEAIGALGQVKNPEAEAILIARLKSLEKELADGRAHLDENTVEALDRLCAGIARQGTVNAIRTVVGHAFSGAANLGDTYARLDYLSRQDLSIDPQQLAVLLEAVRAGLPAKLLGFVRKRPPEETLHLIRAISGTPTPEVRGILREVTERFDGKGIGEEAAKALAKLDAKPATAPAASSGGSAPSSPATGEALSGDLELFALPTLLQSLADSQSSGEIVLFDRSSTKRASISLAKGRIVAAEVGKLRGEVAVYQVLERPFPGTFVVRTGGRPAVDGGDGLDVIGVMLEGLRRHDEYQQARTIVPDGMTFEAVGIKPTPPEEETDVELLKRVWQQAATGIAADVVENALDVDGYRIRRMYSHWLEAGALKSKAKG
ncbi:MAG TPA: DUF4388 domain-containing protein [Candidatus Polarisedimenticolaceae bacterium]